MLLENQVALVTGTGPNIGGEIARTLAANGARVVCLDSRIEAAEEAARDINGATPDRAIAVAADITQPDDVERAVAAAVDAFGALHILVNNAGISPLGRLVDIELDAWQATLDVVLTGTFLCSRYAARQMIEQDEGGAIVNVASTSGHRGRVGAIGYATAKGGVLQLTRCMALELAPHKIRVNSVTPNASGMSLSGGSIREGVPAKNPLGRWGTPADQARAVLFLASSQADFITGEDVAVDGGILAGR